MIAKRIDMRDASKSRATRLAKYVTDNLERAGRVGDVFTTNCISDDVLLAAKEIEICQAKNTRAKDDKTYHLLLSFPDGERPDKEQMRAMADAAAKALGYGEHQRIAAIHDDTDNLHMHLIINKIHPKRLTIHTPRHDFKILAELCTKLERANSLQQTNHEPTKSASEAKTRDMEAHSGAESFLSYARQKAAPILSAAQSWMQLHSALAEVGMSLRLKGNGLIMVDHTGTVAVKASSIARDFSKAKLEKQFGVFVPHAPSRTIDIPSTPSVEKPASTYRKTPLIGADSLYQQYQREKKTAWKERKTQLAAIWDNQKQIMRRIAASAKLDLPKAASASLKRKLRLQARATAKTAIVNVRQTMAAKRAEIARRMDVFHKSGERTLLSFVTGLMDEQMTSALEMYTLEGMFGYMLDADEDSLNLKDEGGLTVFEIEDLMAMGDPKIVLPVLLYLFRRIERSLHGQPAAIMLDEAWIVLGHPVFRDKLREWFKIMRKNNCCVVPATQSLSDAVNSGILDVIRESTATKIFLPNPHAKGEDTAEVYRRMGLNSRQVDIIANAIPKRQYYYTSEEGNRLFELALGPLQLSLLAVSDKESLAIVYIGSQSRFVPYVVEVDKLGQANAVRRADRAADVDERVVHATIAAFVRDARMISFDRNVQNEAIWRVFSMLHSGDPATNKLTDYMKDPATSPTKRAETHSVGVEISSVLQQTAETWEVNWTEKVWDRQGIRVEQYRMRGLVTVYIVPPTTSTTEEEIRRNPLGIFVRDFTWSRVVE